MPHETKLPKHYTLRPVVTPVVPAGQKTTKSAGGSTGSPAQGEAPDQRPFASQPVAGNGAARVLKPAGVGGQAADPFMRPAGEDDDGYDPYSDRPAQADPLFQENPWG